VPDVLGQAVERVLVVVAHPDDAEFWVSGTTAAWTVSGAQVTYSVLSDGEAGGFDPAAPETGFRDPSCRADRGCSGVAQ
jgi:LmbE family N-acetylglucosaminyl deacetylase